MRYARLLGCLMVPTLIVSASSPSYSAALRSIQFGLYGFRGKHLAISINSTKVFDRQLDDTADNNIGFVFANVGSPFTIDIVVDRYHQRGTYRLSHRVKSFTVTNGEPITIRPEKHYQGID